MDLLHSWLTTKELSEYLRVTPKQILNWTFSGVLPYYKISNRNRYKKSEIDALLESSRLGGFRHDNKAKSED